MDYTKLVTCVPRTRKQAKECGSKLHFTGVQCFNGHVSYRYASIDKCIQCAQESEHKRKGTDYYKKYVKNKKEEIKNKAAKRYETNKTYNLGIHNRMIKNIKEWIQNNPGKRSAIANNYKHRRRSIENKGCTSKDLLEWTQAQPKNCYWCAKDCNKDGYHIDHYQPLSKGGEHELHNLVIACPACNTSKGAKDPFEFALTKGMLF